MYLEKDNLQEKLNMSGTANSNNSLDKKICLLPVGWDHNLSPEMGGRSQEFINKQVL